MMKRIELLIAVLLCTWILVYAQPAYASIYEKAVPVTFSGGQRTVNAIYVDLNDKTTRIEAAVARNQIGQADDLGNIAAQLAGPDREVVAAINGTFFSAYNGVPLPWGTIQKQGEFIHLGNTGSVVGFTADNRMQVENLFVSIKGATDGKWEWPNNWYAWGFNHIYDVPDAITIFTPAFGATTGPHNKYSIIVDKGTVTQIVSGQAMIPAEGYTIVMGPNELFNRFKVGTKVDYRLEYSKIGINAGTPGEKVDWSRIRTTVGAGPTLLRNGTIIANGAAEGFLEDKINKNRGQRSFIGVTRDNILIMGTVGNVTIRELAEISQNLNLVDAINLDGGASSSLYYNGRYLTSPGRKISNALVVTRLKSVPIRLKLNGEEVFFDSDPLIINNRTLVPMRKIFEKMGVAVGYNQNTGNITAKKDDMLLELKSGSDRVMVNGKEQTMEVPLMLYNNRSYVPVRFVTEMFKGRVDWNQTDNMVILELNS